MSRLNSTETSSPTSADHTVGPARSGPHWTRSASEPPTALQDFEVSVVMPCLNEADTVETCVQKALRAMAEYKISGEVIIADNGSTDGSPELAERWGARVVHVEKKGYGNALMGGIAAARGKYVVMGDADDSYDFLEVPAFVTRLREGYDLVQGCRLPSGGGTVAPGAMPLLHRWWGNPMFSIMARQMFRAPIHDVYCGLRGFTKSWYERLEQRCTGMEFATEMIIRSSLLGGRISEIPITLHPDGRKAHAPHLKTFRDGWRTLRFFLIYSPRWLFLVPGSLLMALGLVVALLALCGAKVWGASLDAHTMLFGSLMMMCGYQSVLFALCTKMFAAREGLLPEDVRLERFFKTVTLERSLMASAVAMAVGVVLLVSAINVWRLHAFGNLDYSATMRLVVPGATLVTLGFQTFLSSFFVSILRIQRR